MKSKPNKAQGKMCIRCNAPVEAGHEPYCAKCHKELSNKLTIQDAKLCLSGNATHYDSESNLEPRGDVACGGVTYAFDGDKKLLDGHEPLSINLK